MNHNNHHKGSNANMKWDHEAPQNPPAVILLSIPPVLTGPTNFNKPHSRSKQSHSTRNKMAQIVLVPADSGLSTILMSHL